ncbi:putative eka-like protein [Erysiphe necator]|uniref:Putative eka-like protein n=1 Tax=Uncinula necator TaxID=52586 RepID=A0A0B1NYS3_UNCNE|nr:putative eka-like protein [Erysiphe necator]
MICTTVISSIDSTLATFTKEVEKEEAVAFKAYLKLAIANFAAVDSSPPPPRVPLHTRSNKGNGNDSSKGKSKEKNLSKIAVAIPRIASNQNQNLGTIKEVELPKIIKNNDISWATVARKGQKKARMVQNINTHEIKRNKESQKVSYKDNSSTSASDKMLFVRLPQDHEWRNLSPAGIREVIVKKLLISPSLIGKI